MPQAGQLRGNGAAQATTLIIVSLKHEDLKLLRLLAELLEVEPEADVLVVGGVGASRSGRIVDAISRLNSRVHWLEHEFRRGSPELDGIKWGLHRRYDIFVQMDAGLVHDPRSIPSLIEGLDAADLVVGSRYCSRGAVQARSWKSYLGSRTGNLIARKLLGLRVRDCTSEFRAWRRESLDRIEWHRSEAEADQFHLESTLLAGHLGLKVQERPIYHVDDSEPRLMARLAKGWGLARFLARSTARRVLRRRSPALPIQRASIPTPTKILVLALGGIGDTVMGFAMFRRLRLAFPQAQITALSMWPQSADLMRDLGVFDEVLDHHFQREPWWKSLRLAWRLRQGQFCLSIQAFPANRFEYNALHWLIGAPRRIGHDYLRGSRWTYLRWLLTDRVPQVLGTHNIHENLRLLAPIGISRGEHADSSLGPLSPEYRAYADQVLQGVERPIVGLHAGSSCYKNLHAKRWPAERFAELCLRLNADLGLQPMLFEGPGDEAVDAEILARCSRVPVIRTPSIRHTAALIQRCSLFVSNDTAPAHLASALDVPTIMLVGPTDAPEVGPFAPSGTSLAVLPNCAPCFRVSRRPIQCRHPEPFACMRNIKVDVVLKEVNRLFFARRARTFPAQLVPSEDGPIRDEFVHARPDCRPMEDSTDARATSQDEIMLSATSAEGLFQGGHAHGHL